MDAAFPNPLDHRLAACPRARSASMNERRSESMTGRLDEDEFDSAVRDALPQLVSIARRLTADEEMAADAIQNALLKASKTWKSFRGDAQVKTWLTRILIHAVRDVFSEHSRRSGRVVVVESSDLDAQLDMGSHQRNSEGSKPDERILQQEREQAVRNAVNQLPQRQREIFGLMVWQNMSAREVGEILDIKPQNVYANMHAAKARLRELLASYFGDDRGESK